MLAHRKEHVKLTQVKLDKRIAASTDRKDLLSDFLRSSKLSHQELRSNSSTVIIAGSETAATTPVARLNFSSAPHSRWRNSPARSVRPSPLKKISRC